MNRKQPLPIDPLLPEILSRMESSANLVIEASPGSGKTTRVPPALLDAKFLNPKQEVWVLVPRRLAAKMAALRVAEERGEVIGETVGYQFRFEKVLGPRTRLKFLTEGMLFRLLLNSPTLPHTGVVILDEFHERHLHTDVAISYLRYLQKHQRPDLKIVVMSATLDTDRLSEFLGGSPIISLEAPLHPVEVSYLPAPPSQPLETLVQNAVKQALSSKNSGDILVFLPGMGEIRRSEENLNSLFGKDCCILPLHGELPKEAQAKIFEKMPRRKIILSTNVAETSLTIEGVGTVIDGGLHRRASYSWWNGVPALRTRPIAKASALQRAGRAGRLGPGRVFRLYTQADFEGRPAFELPEIRRADLSQTILEIKTLKIENLGEFLWYEAPSPSLLHSTIDLLYHLGALKELHLNSPLTPLGQKMAQIPLHPRLARMLITAQEQNTLEGAALLAALISEGELEALDALSVFESSRIPETVKKVRSQILSLFKGSPSTLVGKGRGGGERLAFSLLTGFPDRVAKKRKGPSSSKIQKGIQGTPEVDLVFSQGGSGTVPETGPIREKDYFIVLDVQERQAQGQLKGKVHVSSLCEIPPERLFDLHPSYLKEKEELIWSEETQQVVQVSQINYGQLILEEFRETPKDLKAAEKIFLKNLFGMDLESETDPFDLNLFLKSLSSLVDAAPMEETMSRLKLLSGKNESLKISAFEGSALKSLVQRLFEGITSLKELKEINLAERLLGLFPSEVIRSLSQNLPTSVLLSRGRKVKVYYSLEKPPWIQSRLQDFFGMEEGPKLMQGKIPLTLHLLAPNQRPVQVTTDLKSFWKNAYPRIRKELSRKYPRHAWPEDPLH